MEGVFRCAKCDVDLVDELEPLPEDEKKTTILGSVIGEEEADDIKNAIGIFTRPAKKFFTSEKVKKVVRKIVENFWVFLLALLFAERFFYRLISFIFWRIIPDIIPPEKLYYIISPETFWGQLVWSLRSLLISLITEVPLTILFCMGLLFFAYKKNPRAYLTIKNILICVSVFICQFFLLHVCIYLESHLFNINDLAYNMAAKYLVNVPFTALSIISILVIYIFTINKSNCKKLFLSINAGIFYALIVFIWFISYLISSYFMKIASLYSDYGINYIVWYPVLTFVSAFLPRAYLFLHSKRMLKEHSC
jgi:hypothetical protein